NAGSGYVSAPTVTFSAPPSGTTATGYATMVGGFVTGIVITNPGTGYTTEPTVTLSAPPAGGTTATAAAFLSSDSLNSTNYTISFGNTLANTGTQTNINALTGPLGVPLYASAGTVLDGGQNVETIGNMIVTAGPGSSSTVTTAPGGSVLAITNTNN